MLHLFVLRMALNPVPNKQLLQPRGNRSSGPTYNVRPANDFK